LPATKPKNHILEALHISDRALLPQLYQSLGSTAGGLTVQLGSYMLPPLRHQGPVVVGDLGSILPRCPA
jgi:hypothetical protein